MQAEHAARSHWSSRCTTRPTTFAASSSPTSSVLRALPLRLEILLVLNGSRDRSLGRLPGTRRRARIGAARRARPARLGARRARRACRGRGRSDLLHELGADDRARSSCSWSPTRSPTPSVVLKANRRIRESRRRRLGSLLYNIECRALFDLSVWDINGTPKIFPRSFDALRALQPRRRPDRLRVQRRLPPATTIR